VPPPCIRHLNPCNPLGLGAAAKWKAAFPSHCSLEQELSIHVPGTPEQAWPWDPGWGLSGNCALVCFEPPLAGRSASQARLGRDVTGWSTNANKARRVLFGPSMSLLICSFLRGVVSSPSTTMGFLFLLSVYQGYFFLPQVM
jgi:hypothetical protein